MIDLLPDELLDSELTIALGPLDDETSKAIAEICRDALRGVLGPALVAELHANRRLLPLVAPWLWDLARGLQFQSVKGAEQPPTSELLACLSRPAGRALAESEVARFAETIDMATVLTLDRLLDHVLGPGAGFRNPLRNEVAAPWLGGLQLGYRIHIAQELLRLSASA